jgi:hypothetical protein
MTLSSETRMKVSVAWRNRSSKMHMQHSIQTGHYKMPTKDICPFNLSTDKCTLKFKLSSDFLIVNQRVFYALVKWNKFMEGRPVSFKSFDLYGEISERRTLIIIQNASEITPRFAAAAAQALVVRGGPDLCPWVALALPFQSPSWYGAVSI